MGILLFLIIGAVAGWIAGNIMRGGGFGLWGNMGVGVAGALVGGMVFRLFGVHAGGMIGSLITSVVGAVALLAIIGLLRR